MTITLPETLNALLLLAAGAGVVHTLSGPDHYLPVIAIARSRRWNMGRTACLATGLGIVHCLVSVGFVLGLLLLSGVAADAVAGAAAWLDGMARAAAWSMIAAGAVIGIGAWRRRRVGGPALALLAVAFAVGPCEWLIPFALAAGGSHGVVGALQVAAVFTLTTVATMVGVSVAGAFGLRKAATGTSRILAAVTCTACGVLMLCGV